MRIVISIFILVVLGAGAALAAALLIVALRAEPEMVVIENSQTKEVTVLVAARDLPSATALESSAITTRVMQAREAPDGSFSDPTQIVGRVLAVPVKQGQAFTAACFPKSGGGVQVAGLLPSGKRAVTVGLSDASSLRGLLYPGSVVDVIASFRLGGDDIGTAVSTTLLERVEVLAVEQLVVGIEPEEKDEDEPPSAFSRGNRLLVTLMVDAKEAEALQLASEHGTVSLALRNPNDRTGGTSDATVLSGGKLAQLAQILAPSGQLPAPPEPEPAPEPEPEPEPEVEAAPPPPPIAAPPDPIQVTVIRGQSTETVSFPAEGQ